MERAAAEPVSTLRPHPLATVRFSECFHSEKCKRPNPESFKDSGARIRGLDREITDRPSAAKEHSALAGATPRDLVSRACDAMRCTTQKPV